MPKYDSYDDFSVLIRNNDDALASSVNTLCTANCAGVIPLVD